MTKPQSKDEHNDLALPSSVRHALQAHLKRSLQEHQPSKHGTSGAWTGPPMSRRNIPPSPGQQWSSGSSTNTT